MGGTTLVDDLTGKMSEFLGSSFNDSAAMSSGGNGEENVWASWVSSPPSSDVWLTSLRRVLYRVLVCLHQCISIVPI